MVHDQILHISPEPEKHGATGMIGHFTQLVWHDTYQVGCGFMQTKEPEKDRIKSVSRTRFTIINQSIKDNLRILSRKQK